MGTIRKMIPRGKNFLMPDNVPRGRFFATPVAERIEDDDFAACCFDFGMARIPARSFVMAYDLVLTRIR